MNFSYFQKPSRYTDSEFNSINPKNLPGTVRMALAFPDVYEIGMSHLGLRVLYRIINDLPFASAERVFSPWTDLEEYMRRTGSRLSSLETARPLSEFDIVGFSLQYELSYTTVLNMLHLGGIPLRSGERLDAKKQSLPLVIAGGPCTVNPAPMAAFIDAFLIGDGEEAVVELLDTVRRWKAEGDGKRGTALLEISKIEGFYVPSVHERPEKVKRRFVMDLDSAPYPENPVVPFNSIVHDRVNIEVARGCTMGCRFCQAGIIYRPVRERSPERVLALAENSLKNTGYEELSFTSLSAGDYSHLLPLIKECNRRFSSSRVAISLPSLRVATVDREVLKEIRSIRKTGFTMAPEAATERLRSVINKDFTEEDYEKALYALFGEGWLTLKLYFMIGLPTERDEDIEAIKEMLMKALRIAKQNTGRFVNISVTVSPFIPKAHTPFQWCGQISLDEMRRKLSYLKGALSSKKFKYKGHNEETSLLEAIFARGDGRLSDLIEKAWESGCRLDGWSEMFDFGKWLKAMDAAGIDGPAYAQKVFDRDDKVPWDMIDTGVNRDFLFREYGKALEGERTADCRKSCGACGLKCKEGRRESDRGRIGQVLNLDRGVKIQDLTPRGPSPATIRLRSRFSKSGRLRYLSHLELVTAVIRGLRRAGVPLDFSKGFHPSPKVSLGPPLSVGCAGEREYFDMEVFTPFDAECYMGLINEAMPEGLRVDKMAVIPANSPSLNSFVSKYEYRIDQKTEDRTGKKLPEPLWQPGSRLIVLRDSGEVDLAPCIEGIVREKDGDYRLILKDYDNIKVRIGEMVEALFGIDRRDADITRTALYGWKDGWAEPL